ncbi:hypothetical protein GCM10009844_23220 [Nocardioides koreensis]|uniref:Uncharacterized protein n=1 Tax=Nocardioides koreensis TaxID=433651 RepID=A0ABN2ZSD9_9ACTN
MSDPHEPAHEQETDVRDSNPNSAGPDRAAGGMGVSSERVGPTGPGQVATDGVRDVSPEERDADADVPPEQSTGNPEPSPEGLAPKAGYSSKDPRSD